MVQERNGEKIYVCRKNLSKMESLSRKGNETFLFLVVGRKRMNFFFKFVAVESCV